MKAFPRQSPPRRFYVHLSDDWSVFRETIVNLEWLKEEKISRAGPTETVVERADGAETQV